MDAFLVYFHIVLAVVSQVIAVITTLVAILFLALQRRIKRRKINFLTNPSLSLEGLESAFSKLLIIGFTLLSFTVVSGFSIHFFLKINTKYMNVKITWAVLVWLWYFVSLLFKEKFFQSRTISAQMCSAGCLFLLTAWFGFIF